MPSTPGSSRTVIAVRSQGAGVPRKSGLPVLVRSETIVARPLRKENTKPTVRSTGTASYSSSCMVSDDLRDVDVVAPASREPLRPSHCSSVTR